MNLLKLVCSFFLLSIGLFACTKGNGPDEPNHPDSIITPKPDGILYLDCIAEFEKLNVADSSVIWKAKHQNYGSAAGNQMIFDSTNFYFGNNTSLFAYSRTNGANVWRLAFNTYPEDVEYREAVLNDTIILITSPTGRLGRAELFCANKKTGVLKWRQPLDGGPLGAGFNTTPVLSDNKVILATQDQNKKRQLTAFNIGTGAKEWAVGVDDKFSPKKLMVRNGKVYATADRVISCFNAGDGSVQWQTSLPDFEFNLTAAFLENDTLLLVKVMGYNYNIVALNATDGKIINSGQLTIPNSILEAYSTVLGAAYADNKLVIATRYTSDTLSFRCYDLSAKTWVWEKRYASGRLTGSIPLMVKPYILFPVSVDLPARATTMYFLDFSGNELTRIPLNTERVSGFTYEKNGVLYRQNLFK